MIQWHGDLDTYNVNDAVTNDAVMQDFIIIIYDSLTCKTAVNLTLLCRWKCQTVTLIYGCHDDTWQFRCITPVFW